MILSVTFGLHLEHDWFIESLLGEYLFNELDYFVWIENALNRRQHPVVFLAEHIEVLDDREQVLWAQEDSPILYIFRLLLEWMFFKFIHVFAHGFRLHFLG